MKQTEEEECRKRILWGSLLAVLICILIINFPDHKPQKSYVKQNTHRLGIRPCKQLQGHLFDKPVDSITTKKYTFGTSYPTLNEYCKVKVRY